MFKFKRNYKTEETAYVKNVKEDGTEEYVETKIPSYGTEEVGLVGFIKGMRTDGPVLKDTTGTPEVKENHTLRNVLIFAGAVGAAAVGYHMITKDGNSNNGDQVIPGQAPQQIPMPTPPQQIQMENPYTVPEQTFVAAEPEVVEQTVTPEVTEV